MPGTRKLGRDTAHRTAMLRGLVTFFLENGKIETTVTRAKEVRALAEKMITIAKQDNLHKMCIRDRPSPPMGRSSSQRWSEGGHGVETGPGGQVIGRP